MTPYYSDDWLTLYGGDCRTVLAGLPADSVDCVVTSPPYWGLRDYGTATWIGGDADHEHVGTVLRTADVGGSIGVRSGDCACGAQRIDSQLGLERTPEEYVANMVAVFREVRRVLKPSGTVWLNLGDSYAGYWGDKKAREEGRRSRADTNGWTNGFHMNARPDFHAAFDGSGVKPKDLVGIPWRVAFALQADGWYLRSDIIWAKPNPMPESVTDRPTKAHEYLFLLTKSARYYFDADAVREPHVGPLHNPGNKTDNGRLTSSRNIRSVWTIATRPYPGAHFAVFPPELPERCIKAGSPLNGIILDPFGGSGTVGMVANRLSRCAILIDLNPEYLRQQMERNAQTPLGLDA